MNATSTRLAFEPSPVAIAACVLLTAAAMAICASMDWRSLSWALATLIPVVLVVRAVIWDPGQFERNDRAYAARIDGVLHHAACTVWVFVWGSVVLSLGYGFTALYWQHWWQYALAMALLAAAVKSVSRVATSSPALFLRVLGWSSIATSLAALAGLAFLFASGKLDAGKSDWLANQVFLCGGLAIAAITGLGGVRDLQRRR